MEGLKYLNGLRPHAAGPFWFWGFYVLPFAGFVQLLGSFLGTFDVVGGGSWRVLGRS
jgi:hypothetical protein